jgi:hypothetical protein
MITVISHGTEFLTDRILKHNREHSRGSRPLVRKHERHRTSPRIGLRRLLGLLCTSAVSLSLSLNPAKADPIYLATGPNFSVGGEVNNCNYGNNYVTFAQAISDNGLNIGNIIFEYNTYIGSFTNPGTGVQTFPGGAALSGAFFASSKVAVPTDAEVDWVQVVTTNAVTNPGIGASWGASANQPYPDTASPVAGKVDSPNYPNQSLTNNPNGPTTLDQPSAGFQDYPVRSSMSSLVVNWQAELGLVLENPKTHVATVLGTFTWGFIMQAVDPTTTTIANISPITPYSSNQTAPGSPMTGPSSGYLSTLSEDFDGGQHGSITSTAWKFNVPGSPNSLAFHPTPEPSGVVLLLSGGVAVSLYGLSRRMLGARH